MKISFYRRLKSLGSVTRALGFGVPEFLMIKKQVKPVFFVPGTRFLKDPNSMLNDEVDIKVRKE